MNFFDAQTDLTALAKQLDTHTGIIVACYCAAWCDTCKQYRPGFESLAERLPQHVFVWIDVEENEALLDDEEIENFPTLLVQSGKGNLFFGPMPPHHEHIERLLHRVNESPTPVMDAGPGQLKSLLD